MPRLVKEPESLQPQQTEAISKLLDQVLSADGTTIHDTVPLPHATAAEWADTRHTQTLIVTRHHLALAGAHARAGR